MKTDDAKETIKSILKYQRGGEQLLAIGRHLLHDPEMRKAVLIRRQKEKIEYQKYMEYRQKLDRIREKKAVELNTEDLIRWVQMRLSTISSESTKIANNRGLAHPRLKALRVAYKFYNDILQILQQKQEAENAEEKSNTEEKNT